jgi:dTDP-4-amino-4,6-dideoxygalactose transaminase
VLQLYDPEEADTRMHPLAERALKCADAEGVAGRRRRNYRYLAEALREGDLVVPFLPELAEGACPFIFPVRVTRDVRRVHAELVIRGIPVCVFPGQLHPSLPRESFPFAYELADSLLALPCHQDLSTADLDRVVEIVRSVG